MALMKLNLDSLHPQVDATHGAQDYGHGGVLQWDLCLVANGQLEPADDLG